MPSSPVSVGCRVASDSKQPGSEAVAADAIAVQRRERAAERLLSQVCGVFLIVGSGSAESINAWHITGVELVERIWVLEGRTDERVVVAVFLAVRRSGGYRCKANSGES